MRCNTGMDTILPIRCMEPIVQILYHSAYTMEVCR